jgi:hypothetical protein
LASSAANHIAFFGTQPTLTQVPPIAPASITATRAPWRAARTAGGDAAGAGAEHDQVEAAVGAHRGAAVEDAAASGSDRALGCAASW